MKHPGAGAGASTGTGTGTGTHALKTMVTMLQGKIDATLSALPPVNGCNFETVAEARELVERLRALLLA